jgi:hypothetical protein
MGLQEKAAIRARLEDEPFLRLTKFIMSDIQVVSEAKC